MKSEAPGKLREAVTSQQTPQFLYLNSRRCLPLAGELGMLVFLRRWAPDHDIRLLLFNPSKSIHDQLKRARSIPSSTSHDDK